MFTQQELTDIEAYRLNPSPTKQECHWMLKFKNRLLQKKEKGGCFCGKADRLKFKTEFFIFWDANI